MDKFMANVVGLKTSPLQRIAAWPLSWAAQKIGKGHIYVPGESGDVYMLTTPFEKNNLTRNSDMYEHWVDQARAVPELQFGGSSMAWLYQGLPECRSLSEMHSTDILCITFCGELGELFEYRMIEDRMERRPNGTFEIIKNITKNARQDILTEIPEVGEDGKNQMVEFFGGTEPVECI